MGDDQRRPSCVRPQERRELELAFGVDAAGRLVEDEQVGVGREHGRQREAFALTARQVARMPVLAAGETDCGECATGGREIAVDADRDLLDSALTEDVAARIL